MLKLYRILAIFAIATVCATWGMAASFASDIVSNDDPASAPVAIIDAGKAADGQGEAGISGQGEADISGQGEAGISGSYLSSQFSRSTGDINSATRYLQSVYKQNPNNMDLANQLMGLYLLGGDVDKAMEIASAIAKNNDKEPIAALMLALRAIKNNDAPSASRILDKISEDEGGQLWLPLISAWLDVEQHKLLKPLMMEELSAEVGRAAPIVSYHLALINARAGFTDVAAGNFKQSIIDPARPPSRVMEMLLRFYKKNNSPPVLKPLVKAYREANPGAPKAMPMAINNMQDGAAEVLLTMGSIMLTADVVQDATLYLQLALYLKPDMEIAIITLAQAYSELQQYGIANELLEKISPESSLYNIAQLYTAVNFGYLKKTDEALVKLDGLIAASPDSLEAYMAKGDLLRSQGRFSDAVAVYKAAVGRLKEVKAQHWPIFFAIGTCFDKQGNWADAEKNLKRSLELSPNQPDVLNYLGYSLLIRGEKFSQAKELIEKAIKKRPSDPQIMDSMGLVLYMSGDYKQSVIYLERAVSLLPADVTVNDHLGDVYWRLGRKTEARFQWNRALTYAKDDVVSQEIRRKFEDGLPQENSADTTEKNVEKNGEKKSVSIRTNPAVVE